MIEIGFCTDNNYIMACGISILSIINNNKDNHLRFHILTNGLSKDNNEKILQISLEYEVDILIYKISDSDFEGLPITDQFQKSIYYRYMFSRILDSNISKLIYLDCDTIVLGNITELWNTNIDNHILGAVLDQNYADIRILNRLNLKKEYFNSGVLLFNLKKWEELNCTEQCIQYIKNNIDLIVFPDQDAINIVLLDNILKLDFKFNFQELFHDNNISNLFVERKRWFEIQDAKDDLVIIH